VPVLPSASALSADRPHDRRRLSRRLFAVLLILAVSGGIAVVEVPQFLSPAPTETIWQAITDGIHDGTVPKQAALEAFAYVYKVDIPDVTVPKGTEGGDGPTSGTGVMSWVQANWNALTADQQAVVNRYLPPATEAGTNKMTPAPTAAAAGAALPRFQLEGVVNPWPINTNVAPDAPTDLAMAMASEVVTDIAHIGPKLGLPVIGIGLPGYPSITLTLSDADGGDALFLTQIVENTNIGYFAPCAITAYSSAWKGEAVNGSGGVSPRLHVLITHEVVHCYQNTIWGSMATALLIPSWMKEGTAMYLAADDTQVAEPTLVDVWTKGYIGRDETALVDRTYDSFGYFAFLAHQGRDLWNLMAPAWEAAAKGPERSNAFIAVLQGDAPDIVDNWAESYLRRPDWQDPWIMYGFGLPDTAAVKQHPVEAQTSPSWTGTVNSRANTVLIVDDTSGEVVTVATDGLASVHDETGNEDLAFHTETFCTVDSCVCPPGTLLAGQNMASQHLEIPFVAAINGAVGGSKYAIIADTLDHLCKRQATPAPQGTASYGPCGQNCTQSNGDPHLVTVNKIRYNFQSAGEFTLLRSADDSLEIQGRQEPYQTSTEVSINTAIAAKVGSHRVGVYVVDSGLQARVDGSVVDLTGGPQDLGSGARISAVSKGFEIDFPDGTQMWTLAVGSWGINAQIKPSDSLKTSGVGLLGPVIPGGLGVPALPDGTRLPAATNDQEHNAVLYGQFADAWRVSDSTTLFDYDPGKSAASYVIRPFPVHTNIATLADLSADQTAVGNSACAAITDQGLHDDCVFDVGVTGQTGFVGTYQATQFLYDSGVAAPTSSPGSTASAPTGVVNGAVTVTNGTFIGGYALGPDDTVYMTVQTGDNKFSLIAFDPKAGKIVQQVSVPAATPVHVVAGSVWLPGLKTDATGHNCSITRFDAGTLAEQATIPVPCNAFGSAGPTATDGDGLWFEDDTKYDSTTLKGAVITRIDPTTNAPGTSVPLPSVGGRLLDSQGALFYADEQRNYFRLTTGSTSFDSLGSFTAYFSIVPAGTGLWASDSTAKTAKYFTQSGTPQVTLQVGHGVVAGDTQAAYSEVLGNSDQGVTEEQLWRYPIDGSPPTQIAVSPTLDGDFLDFFGDPLPIANGDGVLKLWSTHSGSQQVALILLEWSPAH
jgi:hypothetical protein